MGRAGSSEFDRINLQQVGGAVRWSAEASG
jgi:hypothetical protein